MAHALRIARETSAAIQQRTRIHQSRPGTSPRKQPAAAINLTNREAEKFLGHRTAALSRRPDVGNIDLLAAALSENRQAFRSQTDCDVRLGTFSCCRSRLSFRSGRYGNAPEIFWIEAGQCAAQHVHAGRLP